MLIAKSISTNTFTDGADLRSRFETSLNDHYKLGTITGKLVLFFYALYHCSSPSAFLAKQLNQDLQFYVGNVSRLRRALYEFEARHKAGRIPDDVSFKLTDGSAVNMRLKYTGGQIDSLCVKDERTGTWEALGLLPEQFLIKIENDILNNPDLFDSRLIASCKLRPAFENIEALQKMICKEKMEAARKAGKFNPEDFDPGSTDDFQILLANPENVHGRFFIEHVLDIAENLVGSGFYGVMHPDESNFKEFQSCSLHLSLIHI